MAISKGAWGVASWIVAVIVVVQNWGARGYDFGFFTLILAGAESKDRFRTNLVLG